MADVKDKKAETGRRSLLDDILATIERRSHQRFRLEIDVRVLSDRIGPLPGQSFDISETGMSALLPVELLLRENVRLVLTLPLGLTEIDAIVRSRNTFRHGFEFVAPNPSRDLIRRSCDLLTPCPYER
jgi:PilZ domain